jgi:hypothetical protein
VRFEQPRLSLGRSKSTLWWGGFGVSALGCFCSIDSLFFGRFKEDRRMSETKATSYKSPVRKLVVFFRGSRDGWKEKHHEVKAECKKLSNQVRAVEKSRQQWREQAQTQERRVRELEREVEELKRALA